RVGKWIRSRLEELGDEPAIPWAAVEQFGGSTRAHSLKVQSEADLLHPGMLGRKRVCSHVHTFFPVREDEDDIVFERRACSECPHGFQQRHDGSTIVTGSRASRRRVIVS